MGNGISIQITSTSPNQTDVLAQAIAPLLVAGDCLLLSGDIGAGKSHFCRAVILQRLLHVGLHEDVPSPTYTLVQTYDDTICDIWHADLYRLTDPQEVVELGLQDAFDSAICLVEWPDRLAVDAPQNALSIHIAPTETDSARILTFAAIGPYWEKLFPVLRSVAGE
jgi:tRNA threonylcarbamoyladenosine biosynthesis protein TsaE